MLTFMDVLNDDKIIEEYKKIDRVNKTPFNHGLNHVKNVCEIMDKLTDALNIKGEEKQCLLLAASLHDIGQVDGRESHGKKACEYIINNLKSELENYKYYEDILNAIRDHSEKVNLLELPVFTNLLCFADKMDFSFKRLEKDYKKTFPYSPYEDVIKVDFYCNNDTFTLKIETTSNIDKEDLLNEGRFFYKVICAFLTLTKKLNLNSIIKVNEEVIDLNEVIKKDYPNVEKYVVFLN